MKKVKGERLKVIEADAPNNRVSPLTTNRSTLTKRGVGGEVIISLFATLVYLLTMDRSVSWWDCGEFIATSWTLGVGHPPGAPFYQLVVHCVMLLSFGNPMLIAPLSNAVSAICGGATVGVLYKTIKELLASPPAPLPQERGVDGEASLTTPLSCGRGAGGEANSSLMVL